MFKKALIAAAMLAAVAGAQAQSANFGVTGTITPAACGITLSGGGVADYGALQTPTVKAYPVVKSHYVFGSKVVAYSVTCSAATPLQMAFIDNKAAQKTALDANDPGRYGIGDGTTTTAIGSYEVVFTSAVVDGTAAAGYLSAPTGTTTWTNTASGTFASNVASPGRAVGFKKLTADTAPTQLTTVAGNLSFNTYVLKSYVDASTAAITLNGSGTVTLQYL